MKRVPESKPIPAKFPLSHEVPPIALQSIRELGDVLDVDMTFLREVHHKPEQSVTSLREELARSIGDEEDDLHFTTSLRTDKVRDSRPRLEKFRPGAVNAKGFGGPFRDIGPGSFSGASHPPEPVDMDLMKPVIVPLGRAKPESGPLFRSMSIRGQFLEDFSISEPSQKPCLPDVLSSSQILVEESDESNALSYTFFVPPASSLGKNVKDSLPAIELDEKQCVWDASLPPSVNVSPHSSVDTGLFTAMSIANSCSSTNKSDGLMSDGVASVGRNCESMKGSNQGDSLESAKTSASRVSGSSGLSEESNWSNITGSANKPHKGNDPHWKAILAVRARDGILGMSHFRLLKRFGCGDIGTVYLSELNGTHCYFAMKVMDKESLSVRKKLIRAQTEREILQLLDHPFLPTLYSHFETDRFLCLVMEFCPGGDLHTLRQRQPGKHFLEYAARFYAAEVLLALEYLHMLGVVYRDLKPENVLVREDGHIMLSDFDLSLQCTVSPTLIKTSSYDSERPFCIQPSCTQPSSACIQPSCFLPRLFPSKGKKKNGGRAWAGPQISSSNAAVELVAEPTSARSMSFVGTHEYLAPEIIKGEGHGSAVDWWTFGIFLYELLFGKTPFKGSGNRATLFNVVGQQLKFPDAPATSHASRDLIQSLLIKEPQNRLGVKRGATEIKQHPFFEGVNWALIRCSTPPEVPRPVMLDVPLQRTFRPAEPASGVSNAGKRPSGTEMRPGGNFLDIEFF
ncbi:hypothetical protein SAY87_022447 [Trapa incisa]|uniref:non-specific serine/threonine protein kinase n=1 Tax=Trapa incisa TaxID=236973 RepID=A0AAN7Q466_9MYRT|nr:hypothetical protein SAY87_022447 [Trapa incisa]